jgi:hypothetical protein
MREQEIQIDWCKFAEVWLQLGGRIPLSFCPYKDEKSKKKKNRGDATFDIQPPMQDT